MNETLKRFGQEHFAKDRPPRVTPFDVEASEWTGSGRELGQNNTTTEGTINSETNLWILDKVTKIINRVRGVFSGG